MATKDIAKREEQYGQLDKIVGEYSMAAVEDQGQFRTAFSIARAVQALQSAITPEMLQDVMALQNTSLGFRTDKQGGGYPAEVVRECMIEATLRGVRPCGNEFNIISGRTYITKEGFGHLLRTFRGLSDLREIIGIPAAKEGGAIVHCSATWKLNGKEGNLECDIPVKVNSGMGADAIIGKATRKLRARIYNQLTGSRMGEAPEGEIDDVRDADAKVTKGTAGLAEKLKKGKEPKAEAKTEAVEQTVEEINQETGEVTQIPVAATKSREPGEEGDEPVDLF